MRGNNGIVRKVVKFITFADMPIQKKFLVFSLGVAIWFLLLAIIGIAATENDAFRRAILGFALVAISLLIFFAVWLSRSLTKPINKMISQIDSLSEGDISLKERIVVGTKDEIGVLSSSFNKLLDTIEDMNSFKKVIEEDDTPEDIYKRLGIAFGNLGLDCYQMYEISNSKNTMKPVLSSIEDSGEFCNRDILVNCNLCRAKKTGDVVSSSAYKAICKHFTRQNELQHICVPMIIGDSTGGVVQFVFDPKTDPASASYMQKKILRAKRYVQEALPVLEAKRLMDTLKESSLRDPMTGLYNRRFLEEYTETLVAMIHRRNTILGILMCDLDFFKEVNDTYGHTVGDAVLKETAHIIRDSVRASDMVIRFGGEEFLAVLMDMHNGTCLDIAEKIRKKIEATKIKMPRGFLQKTISIGISEFPKDTANFWQAIKFSDIALYKAKDSGRNQVIRFSRDMWTSEEY